ncbi:hypothetical protein [Mycobacterium sp. 1245805.9]|uniref:hypothetical protein n=1 Tax=Mycobacterium sp. 1245805.9 TaxID=1856862 RepID=UPI0007FF0998|nr:hypothetical protein [Mycobacterium sp. 1245805.9]OBI92946.1 hypothetical protein A9X00_14635 [Mycobacterium sp. 1245805.9]
MRTPTTTAAGGLAVLALVFGSGVAHADSRQDREKEACQLMDDPAGPESGYAPAEYAFMTLRAKMSAEDARNVMSMAAQDFCPNHIVDLPASWR